MTIADLRPTDEMLELRARVRAFMEEHVYPNERALGQEDEAADELVERLRGVVKEQGLWAPHLPPEAGGSNGSFLVYAHLNEVIGRSTGLSSSSARMLRTAATRSFCGTSAPPSRRSATSAAPTAEVRSFFGMTEPEVSGSDPTDLRTTAVRDGGEWVIDGHKWFSSNANGSAFGIVMAVERRRARPPSTPRRSWSRLTRPACDLVRPFRRWGTAAAGHCEVR